MRGVIIHALLAVFGLVFAYQTWTRKPDEAPIPGMVSALECSRDGLQKLTFNTSTLEVQAEPRRDNGELKFWITTRHRSPEEVAKQTPGANPGKIAAGASDKKVDAPKPDAGTTAAAAAGDAPKKREETETPEAQRPKTFLANAAFEGYLKRLTPMRALRSLGKLDKKQDADFGYDKSTTFLEVECGGRSIELVSGTRAFGGTQRYMRDTKSEVSYLFDEPTVSDLESAQFKFMQAELHDFKPEEIEEVTLTAQNTNKKLLHRDRKLPDQQWVDEKAPAKRNELFNNWMSRLSRLRARVYLAAGSEPGSDLKAAADSTQVLRMDYKVAERAAPGKLELVRVDENGVGHYYARTETTRGWVALFDSSAKEVEQDVGMVLGLEQAPAAKEAPAAPSGAAPHGAAPHGAAPHGAAPHGLPSGHPTVPGH